MATRYAPGLFAATRLQSVYWKPAPEAVVHAVATLGCQRVFIIASRTLEADGGIKAIQEALGDKLKGTWSGMRPHSPREDVLAAADAVRAAGGAELLVSVGGGSVTDGTKAVNMCLDQGITSVDEFDSYVRLDVNGLFDAPHWEHHESVRQVAVPTTLSSGEFTHIVGVTDTRGEHSDKQQYTHPKLQPVIVIFDPALTLHTPEWLWLSTGVRAVDHATEALCSIDGTHLSSSVASGALTLLAQALPETKRDPTNLDARLRCQIGAWQAISTLMMGVNYGASHGIGHVLGGTAGVSHGYTSCINLPYVLKYNAAAIPDKMAAVAKALDAPPGCTAANAMDTLIRSLGMPRTLSDVNFPLDKLDAVCRISLTDPWIHTNPRKLSTAEEVRTVLQMAIEGEPNLARAA